MSQAPPPSPDSELVDEAEQAWSCDSSQKHVRVKVWEDGRFVEIPTTEVITELRTDLSDRDSYSRVFFPLEWQGYRPGSIINAWTQRLDFGKFDVATVEWKDELSNEWTTVQTGYVRGVGGAPTNGVGKFTIEGFETLLRDIRTSANFGKDSDVRDVLRHVVEEFESTGLNSAGLNLTIEVRKDRSGKTGLTVNDINKDAPIGEAVTYAGQQVTKFSPLNVPSAVTGQSLVFAGEVANILGGVDTLFGGNGKKFNSNEDTLLDVLEWVTDKLDAEWYFDEGGTLVVNLEPDSNRLRFEDIQVENTLEPRTGEFVSLEEEFLDLGDSSVTDCKIIENDALREISPLNATWVRGDTMSWAGSALTWVREQVPGGEGAERDNQDFNLTEEYPLAVAWYPPLIADDVDVSNLLQKNPVDRRGAIGNTFKTEISFPSNAESRAKKELAEAIKNIGEGDILMYGKPYINPNDKLTALPTNCESAISEDVFDYQISSIRHVQKGGGVYETMVDCTVYVNENKIETESTTFKQ